MAGIGGQAMKSDGNYSAPKRMKMKINGSERMSPTSLQGVVNEVNQVMSYQLTGLAEAHEERAQHLREIHERYLLNGGLIEDRETVKNSQMALKEKCCNVLELYATAGWKNIPIKGDEFHYTDRLVTEVKISQHDEGLLAKKNEFRQALKKCFSDKNDQPGVYIDPDTILQNMSEVKELFMQEEAGRIWNKEVEAAYQNLIPHIKNCLALPDHIKPIVYDRNGNYVLKRGTNAAEALWRVLLRYLPDNCSVMLGDTVIKLLCSEINVKRYVQYDSRFPFMEIPFLAFGDLILFTAMSEKMGVPCCFPKIRIIDRDYKNVFFGWDAATHFVSGQQQKLRHNVKPVKSIDIPMEADQYLLDEIMVATASSKTHLYVLNTLEDEMQNSIHSSFPSSGCASACSTSNHEVNIQSIA